VPTGKPGWALLKEARLRAGLTQRELAARAGVPQSTVSVYERGERQPTLPTLERLLRAAGFTLRTDLAPIGPDPRRNGRVLKDLLELADRIPPSRRRPLTYPRLPSTEARR
jgi:transcriptional regulator with XRE-family HTH domain